jgi:hypothetical protein
MVAVRRELGDEDVGRALARERCTTEATSAEKLPTTMMLPALSIATPFAMS